MRYWPTRVAAQRSLSMGGKGKDGKGKGKSKGKGKGKGGRGYDEGPPESVLRECFAWDTLATSD